MRARTKVSGLLGTSQIPKVMDSRIKESRLVIPMGGKRGELDVEEASEIHGNKDKEVWIV